MTVAAGTPDSPRRPAQRGAGEQLRTELLDAAAELLGVYGNADQVSLRAVARRVGVSPTAVYLHFPDHRSLVSDALRHCWQEFDSALRSAAAGVDDPFVAFARTGAAYAEFALARRGHYRVLFSGVVELDPGETVGDQTFDLLVHQVTAMLAANGDERDPVFVSRQVHSWIHGIVDLRGADGRGHSDPADAGDADAGDDVGALLDALATALGLTPAVR